MVLEDIHFRIPTVVDAEVIGRLHVASWREAYAGIVPASILDTVDVDDRIARWRAYLASDGVTFLAEVDGVAVGFIRAGALAEPLVEGADGHIFALYIRQRHHRKGIGRRLLARAAAEWLARGGRALSVGVLTENAPALAFYQGVGARFTHADSYRWDGHELPESIYVFRNLQDLSRGQ
jgi:ribosomal protein S18 acetylase RimI-like enzyme